MQTATRRIKEESKIIKEEQMKNVIAAAKADGDKKKTKIIEEKIKEFKKQSISEILAEGIKWMEKNKEDH